MTRIILPATVLLLAAWSVSSGSVDLGTQGMQAFQVGGAIEVTWTSIREENLNRYELWRKTPFDVHPSLLARIEARGPREYKYTDRDVYKAAADNVEYVLYAAYNGDLGGPVEITQVSTQYTSTSVRRTWGSIKAMFQ